MRTCARCSLRLTTTPVTRFQTRSVARAKRVIAEKIHGAEFARLWNNPPPAVTIAVAVVPAHLAFRGKRLVWLGGATLQKLREKHKVCEPQKIALVQTALDGGDVFRQPGRESGNEYRWLLFARDESARLWSAGIKRTSTGKFYLSTFHRARNKQLLHARKKFEKVKR